MKITFDHKYFHKPFSYIVCENFLSVNDQNKIIEEIIDLKNSFEVNKVMGGRFQYNMNLLKKNSLSEKLYDYFNTKETFELIKSKLFLNEKASSKFYTKQNFNKIIKSNNGFKSKILSKFFPFFFKIFFFFNYFFRLQKMIIYVYQQLWWV